MTRSPEWMKVRLDKKIDKYMNEITCQSTHNKKNDIQNSVVTIVWNHADDLVKLDLRVFRGQRIILESKVFFYYSLDHKKIKTGWCKIRKEILATSKRFFKFTLIWTREKWT